MYKLSSKNFEEPIKGKAKFIREISLATFRKILNKGKFNKSGVLDWGCAVNNSCISYDCKTNYKMKIEEHSYNNTGMNARFYLVLKG